MTRPGARHPRCGGQWRGPLADDVGTWLVCNSCGQQIPAPPGDEEHDMDCRAAVLRQARVQARAREAAAIAALPAPRQAAPVMTAKQAADALGVSVRQLNRYQQQGLIAPQQNVPHGRRQFTEESVDRLRTLVRGS